jgi:hypothetical protein
MKVMIIVAILCAFGIGIATINHAQQTTNATTRHSGRQSKEERARAIYQGTGANVNLRHLAAKANEDVNISVGPGLALLSPTTPAFNFQAVLGNITCEADAIVIGEVRKASPQLTEDESFIFTSYEMTAEEVIKDNKAAPIQSDSVINVARTGGTLQINGHNVKAKVHGFKPLEAGKRYLLFLQFVPERGTYIAHESKGSFLINGKTIAKLTEDQLPSELESGNEANDFINAVRQAAGNSCEGSSR